MTTIGKVVLTAAVAVTAGAGFAWEKKSAPIMTKWAADVTPENALPEYPRPQMVRAEWMNLNGVWEFDGTTGVTNRVPCTDWKGVDEAVFKDVKPGRKLSREILVPFPVESALSGVMERMEYLKYRRTFTLPKDWNGRRIRLNFDAVDWQCEVYVNGRSVGGHKGGYDPFSFDITSALKGGENELIVSVYDPTDNGTQPVGKQRNEPEGYWYTPNSGIWQTVWLEPVTEFAATRLRLIPHFAEGWLGATVDAPEKLQTVELEAFDGGRKVATASGTVNREIRLPVPDAKPWTPDTPFLYDLKITLKDRGRVVDEIQSYFGMRDVGLKTIDGIVRPTINGVFVYQLGTLDQGYWPDGNLRAPTDEALKSDILAHKDLGFNLIRKHIKVEPSRWFYWCDKLGILVWQDMPSMHTHAVYDRKDHRNRRSFRADAAEKQLFEGELKAMVDAHISSPAVVCWVLFNEGWGIYERTEVKRLSDWLSAYDPSRWVNDSTGLPNEHTSGDVYDLHIYPGPSSSPCPVFTGGAVLPAAFQALGEYGGAGLNVKGHNWFNRDGWAYGEMNSSNEDLNRRYLEMQDEIANILVYPGLSASMYTQITDVEGETNGIYTYDRKVLKLDAARVRAAHARIHAAAERVNAGLKADERAAAVASFTVEVGAADEAGLLIRESAEGAYRAGVRRDGTLFIRAEGQAFAGRPAPAVERKTALRGRVRCKVTAFCSVLAIQAGDEFLMLRDPALSAGRFGAYARGGRNTVSGLEIGNPARRIRWMQGPVKFLVYRPETRDVVGADGRKTRVRDDRVISDCNAHQTGDAYWEIEAGLSDAAGVSFRSMSNPDAYLAVTAEGQVNLARNDGTAAFAKRATWFVRPGNERSDFTSFESAARSGEYMRVKGRLVVDPLTAGGAKHDSTFEIVD